MCRPQTLASLAISLFAANTGAGAAAGFVGDDTRLVDGGRTVGGNRDGGVAAELTVTHGELHAGVFDENGTFVVQ